MWKNIAIILAGGEGNRFNSNIPKQYYILYNKPVLYYSLTTFLEHQLIDFILPVINQNHVDIYIKFLKKFNIYNNKKLMKYIIGGNERKYSVYNALKSIKNISNIKKVLIHDSARPFISKNLIDNVLNNVNDFQGCIPILKINDSLKGINKDSLIKNEIDREYIVKAQTPQGFPFNLLLDSYNKFHKDKFTDDAGIFAKNNLKIFTVPGDSLNEKITTINDLNYLKIVTTKMEQRIGQGFDVHAFCNNKKLVLGGITIPYNKGLQGHSDADVVLHALVDSILGALGKGDIGDYFPPTENQWKDANSEIFILKAKNFLEDEQAIINNIDITILCEKPKLGEYKKIIADNISKILEIDINKVNIKATTTEKLGFIGRNEGIAVLAITYITIKSI